MTLALITGITGQDGHYLCELLLARGYDVVGVARHASQMPPRDRLTLRDVDIGHVAAVENLFADFDFDEVYNLAGESFGPRSWEQPVASAETLGVAVVRMLELIHQAKRPIRFFQASSSELFGHASESPQRETTPFRPISPYGFAKLMAHAAVGAYRERYGLFACAGILFNHESPLRRPEFVTRKIAAEVARIRGGLSTSLRLGNLEAKRDWAFAGDFADAMWRMLQAEKADDYVLATGQPHSVRELCETAFAYVGLDYRQYVHEETALLRPDDFDRVGDPSKAMRVLGWKPAVAFRELVAMMVDEEVRRIENADATNLQSL